MSVLHVDTETMAAGAGAMQRAMEDIDALLTQLGGDVDTLLAAWSGPAADAHRAMHQRFARDASTIRTSLAEMHESLLSTRGIYLAQESEQTSDHTALGNQIRA